MPFTPFHLPSGPRNAPQPRSSSGIGLMMIWREDDDTGWINGPISPKPLLGSTSGFLRLVALVEAISNAPLKAPNDPPLGEKRMMRHFDVLRRNRFVLTFQTSDHPDLFGFELVSSVRLFQAQDRWIPSTGSFRNLCMSSCSSVPGLRTEIHLFPPTVPWIAKRCFAACGACQDDIECTFNHPKHSTLE
jgi:hypothetical protein